MPGMSHRTIDSRTMTDPRTKYAPLADPLEPGNNQPGLLDETLSTQ